MTPVTKPEFASLSVQMRVVEGADGEARAQNGTRADDGPRLQPIAWSQRTVLSERPQRGLRYCQRCTRLG